MTAFLAALLLIFPFAVFTCIAVTRAWRLLDRLSVLALLSGFPGLFWFMAFTSLGSGWFFGLIALILTVTSLFGALMGLIWLFLSR